MTRIAAFGLVCVLALALPAAAESPLPNSLRSVGVTVAQWEGVQRELTRAARARNVSERGLAAAAERLGLVLVAAGRDSSQTIVAVLEAIDGQAEELRKLQERLVALEGSADADIAATLADARAAIDEGRFDDADVALAQAETSDLAAIETAESEARSRRLRAATTISERARLAYLRADYLGAAGHYRRAANMLPEGSENAWRYVFSEASSYFAHGNILGDVNAIRDAVRIYEAALVLAPGRRERGMTQADLGGALRVLGERGDAQALGQAVSAYREANIFDRETEKADWLQTQFSLALTLDSFGSAQSDNRALQESIEIFRQALAQISREDAPLDWATFQRGLAGSLASLGERTDLSLVEQAVEAYRAALSVPEVEADREEWATLKNNLGDALRLLGMRTSSPERLEEALAAFRDAQTVFTREDSPSNWAGSEDNVGIVLAQMGRRGNVDVLRASVDAFSRSLAVRTRDAAPREWAATQTNMAIALRYLADAGEPGALNQAIEAYRRAMEVDTREAAPARWANLKHNLGIALTAVGDEASLNEAVIVLRQAMEVRTRVVAPVQWANTQSGLARALSVLAGRGDGDALNEAVTRYRALLEVRTRDADLTGWAFANFELGRLLLVRVARSASTDQYADATAALTALRNARIGAEETGNVVMATDAQRFVTQLETAVAAARMSAQ